jgi:hypothetical protein
MPKVTSQLTVRNLGSPVSRERRTAAKDEIEPLAHVLSQLERHGSGRQLSGSTVEQAKAELVLERPDLVAHGARADVELVAGLDRAAQPHDRLERP